jgi:hypothetical protein
MSGGVVCYIERTQGGAGIKRIRLIAAGLARHWTAPDPRSVSSVAAGEAAPATLGVARAGAAWIAETLNQVGLKRLAAICVDAEGSICAWLSAPSPEPAVVRATIIQSGADGDGGSSGAGVGAARLITESTPGGSSGGALMGDTSVQALATLEPEAKGQGLNLTPWKKKAQTDLVQRKQRYAVLAVQDAIARVLLDELDARGIETDRVVTLWHAMAGAWDRVEAASLNDRLVSANSPGAAVILVEPTGRLIWAWTRSGELVAGGAMRLATRARRDAPVTSGRVEVLATADAAARVVEDDAETENLAIDFTPADAGRLAVDWLSWSAQLGHCPDRVVCLAVPGLGGGAGDSTGPEALFANLTRVWPGATIDGAVHEDPIGATVARLAGLGPEVRVSVDGTKIESPAAERPYHHRPREAMAELSARPGRADRRLYQWVGIALCGAAALVAAVGWQFHRSMDAANAEFEMARKARVDALNAAAIYGPNIPKALKPQDELQTALKKLQDQNKTIKPPKPILRETLRVLAAIADVQSALPPPAPAPAAGSTIGPGDDDDAAAKAADATEVPGALPTPTAGPDGVVVPPGAVPGAPTPPNPANPAMPAAAPARLVLTEIDVGPFAATAKFIVPDAATGPTILEKVQAREGVVQWSGSTGVSVGTGRTYTLVGTWPEDNRPGVPAGPAAIPAPTPPPPTAPAPAPGAKPVTPPPAKPAPGATTTPAAPIPASTAPGPASTAPVKQGAGVPSGASTPPPSTIGGGKNARRR